MPGEDDAGPMLFGMDAEHAEKVLNIYYYYYNFSLSFLYNIC